MTESTYLEFVEVPNPGKKTRVWIVRSKNHGDTLGWVKWFGRWRQYTFFPAANTVWNTGCLDDVNTFIGTAMRERREEARASH